METRTSDSLWTHLTALAKEIGPRPATSKAEAFAHAHGKSVLEGLGAQVRVEEFRSARTFTGPWLGVSLLLFAAGLQLWVERSPVVHAVAALLAVVAGAMHWGLVSGGWEVLRLFPKGTSRNVIGVLSPQNTPQRKVVLVAHVDSTRACLLWHPKLVRGMGGGFRIQTILIVLLILASIFGTLEAADPTFARWLALPGMIVSAWGIFVLLHREIAMPWVQGANDNASGVAVALGVMETLARQPLEHTEVWCVLTGCEEVGAPVGMTRFLERHGEELHHARFLIIDTVGLGEPRYLLGESTSPVRKAHPGMVRLAQELAQAHPEWNLQPSWVPLPAYTDALPALTRGLHALALWCEKEGVLPNWHWHTDTYDRIEPEDLQRSYEVVIGFVKAIDGTVD